MQSSDLLELMDDPSFAEAVAAVSDALPDLIRSSDSRESGSHYYEEPDMYGNMVIDADVNVTILAARLMQIISLAAHGENIDME